MKVEEATRRPGATAKGQRAATPPWRKRRQTARSVPRPPRAIHSSASLTPTASGGATVSLAPTPWLASGANLLATVLRRVRELPVPVEPAPQWSRPAGLAAAAVLDDAPSLAVAAVADAAMAERDLALEAPERIKVGAPAKRASGRRSVKGGPPKAPRTRLATAATATLEMTPPRTAPVHLRPAVLPAVVVPVMAGAAAAAPVRVDVEPAVPTAPEVDLAALVTLDAEDADVAAARMPDALVTGMETAALPAPLPAPQPGPAPAPVLDPFATDLARPFPVLVATRAAASHKRWLSEPVQSVAVERARSTPAQRIGDDGERLAAIRLEALGWRILARNLRVSRAEIDLLAIDPAEPPSLVLVEVRRRARRDYGLAEETVDHRKRQALLRAAGDLAMRRSLPDGRRLPDLPVRVDLIAIDLGPDGRPSIRHHRGIEV